MRDVLTTIFAELLYLHYYQFLYFQKYGDYENLEMLEYANLINVQILNSNFLFLGYNVSFICLHVGKHQCLSVLGMHEFSCVYVCMYSTCTHIPESIFMHVFMHTLIYIYIYIYI